MNRGVVESSPLTSAAVEPATPRKPKFEIGEDDIEEEVSDLGRKNFGELASAYLEPYLHNVRYLDKQYGIRREDEGRIMIGDSTLSVGDICI